MLYFLGAGFLFVVLFGINFAHGIRVHFKQEILPNIAQYLTYITRDIGTPPDLQRAQQLTQDLSFELHINGPGIHWFSSQNIPALNTLALEPAPEPYQHYLIAHHRHNNFVVLRIGEYQFMYVIGRLFKSDRQQRNLIFIGVVMLTLLVLFWLIRRSLKPLSGISQGIQRIGQGELEQPIKPQGSSEFKNLAAGINTMASRIHSMLQGKQQLLLAISHELRSPLTRAKVNVELLPDHVSKQAIAADLDEMQALVTLILESERLNQKHAVLNKETFALDHLIKEVIGRYFNHESVRNELQALSINADKTRLSLLIKNLLDNAIKYSSADDPAPVIRLHEDNSQIIIDVEDFGCGMDEDQLQHITQAFYRIDQARQRRTGGFGLGLYLCKLIVQAHGGSLQFDSKTGQGTRVSVSLPRAC